MLSLETIAEKEASPVWAGLGVGGRHAQCLLPRLAASLGPWLPAALSSEGLCWQGVLGGGGPAHKPLVTTW